MCEHCNDKGVVWVDIRNFGFGPGFAAFMTAGCRAVRNDDGSVKHEIVCPYCNGETGMPSRNRKKLPKTPATTKCTRCGVCVAGAKRVVVSYHGYFHLECFRKWHKTILGNPKK